MVQQSMTYMEDFVCENQWQKPQERRKAVRKEFEEQLTRARIVCPQSSNPLSQRRSTFTGKITGEGKLDTSGKFNDDLLMAAAMNVTLYKRFVAKEMTCVEYDKMFDCF